MKNTILKTRSVTDKNGIPGIVTYGLRYIAGNRFSHFTVTASFRGYNKSGQREDYGGTCHETILDLCPDLKPLVDLHLSDEDGEAMHLFANAESHAGIGKYSKFAPRWLASHLRISDECADDLANAADAGKLRSFIMSQIPRYNAEAKKAIEKFGLKSPLDN